MYRWFSRYTEAAMAKQWMKKMDRGVVKSLKF